MPRPRSAAAAALVAACGVNGASGQETSPGTAAAGDDPVAWLLAQAPPAQAPPPQAPSARDPLRTAPDFRLAAPATPGWVARTLPFLATGEPVGFAPARWGGKVSAEYLGQRGDAGSGRNVYASTVSLLAASYFWQPWFAQVQGVLTVLASMDQPVGTRPTGEPEGATRSLSLSGGGTLTVFPGSRFPFVASFDSTDSRSSGEFTPADQRNTRASLRQTWRDPLGTTTYLGSLDFSRLDSASFGRDSVLLLDGRYLRTAEPHRIDTALAWSRNRRSAGAEGSDILRAFGTHLYTPTPELWVNSLASFTHSAFDGAGGRSGFDQSVGQVTSQAVWRPAFDDRWVLTGGGRLFVNRFSGAGPDATSRSVSGNAGATFAVSEHATLNAAASATQVAIPGGDDALVRFASLGGTYTSPPMDLKVGNYSVSASAQAGHEAGGPESSRSHLAAQADHQLVRSLALGSAVTLDLLANQGIGVTDDTRLGRTDTVRAGASAALRVLTSESSEAYFGASYGQSDSKGGVNDRFRLANVQASGQLRFGPYDSLSANVTAQWVRSRRDEAFPEDDLRQVFGGISYQHSRLFGIPRLRYLLSANFNEGVRTDSRLLGDIDASRENVTRLLDQRVVYDIGRLEIRLGMRIAKVDGRDDAQWYLRIHRQIGQY